MKNFIPQKEPVITIEQRRTANYFQHIIGEEEHKNYFYFNNTFSKKTIVDIVTSLRMMA